MITTRVLDAADAAHAVAALSDLLMEAVDAGASVSFIAPLSRAEAEAFWQEVVTAVMTGRRLLVVADLDGRLVGTVQVDLCPMPNQVHRGEIMKLIVALEARRSGVGEQLMEVAEAAACAAGRTLLTLDTRIGDTAERLYRRLGWTPVGVIPRFARSSRGDFEDAVFFYKDLSPAVPAASIADVAAQG